MKGKVLSMRKRLKSNVKRVVRRGKGALMGMNPKSVLVSAVVPFVTPTLSGYLPANIAPYSDAVALGIASFLLKDKSLLPVAVYAGIKARQTHGGSATPAGVSVPSIRGGEYMDGSELSVMQGALDDLSGRCRMLGYDMDGTDIEGGEILGTDFEGEILGTDIEGDGEAFLGDAEATTQGALDQMLGAVNPAMMAKIVARLERALAAEFDPRKRAALTAMLNKAKGVRGVVVKREKAARKANVRRREGGALVLIPRDIRARM